MQGNMKEQVRIENAKHMLFSKYGVRMSEKDHDPMEFRNLVLIARNAQQAARWAFDLWWTE